MRKTALFALASGCFAAGLCGTPVVITGVSIGLLSPLGLAVLVAACAGVGGTVAAHERVSPADVERLQSRTRLLLAGFGVSGLYLVGTLTLVLLALEFDPDLLYGGLAGSGLTALGVAGMADVSKSLYTERVVKESDLHVQLPSTKTDRQHRIERWVGAAAVLALVAFVAYNRLTDSSTPMVLVLVVVPAIVQLVFGGDRSQAILDAGLKRGNSLQPWDEFEGYEQSEQYLTLVQSGWGTGVRLRRDRLDDETATLSALESVLGESSSGDETKSEATPE